MEPIRLYPPYETPAEIGHAFLLALYGVDIMGPTDTILMVRKLVTLR